MPGMHTVVTYFTDAPQFMYTPEHTHCAHTHTLHTLTRTLHAGSLDNKLLSFWKIQSKCQVVILTNFEHFFGILSPHKILCKSSLCLDLLLSVTPLSLVFCPIPLLWMAWQIEWGWWSGEWKCFLVLIGIIEYFCNTWSRNIRIWVIINFQSWVLWGPTGDRNNGKVVPNLASEPAA